MIIHTELSFGDEVESIRSFDVATQLSLEKQKKITIIPNVNKVFRKKRKFFDYISEKTVLFIQNSEDLFAVG
jgi:transcription-repair coupling factor (superfamily II helicase)